MSSSAVISQNIRSVWEDVRKCLQAAVSASEYKNWLQNLNLEDFEEGELTYSLPSPFIRDYVRSKFELQLLKIWQSRMPEIRRVAFRVASANPPAAAQVLEKPAQVQEPELIPEKKEPVKEKKEHPPAAITADFSASLNKNFTFDSFIVGKPNEFAYACARRVAEDPTAKTFNPLFLYGGVGLGKTHLMHAIGSELLSHGKYTVHYLSSETFVSRFIAAVQSKNQAVVQAFKHQLRSADVVMIDDIQFMIGKEESQQEFFHTFNTLIEAGSQIIITGDKSPSDMDGMAERLKSRLGCGMVADLHATTFELRLSVLQAKAQSSGASIPDKVLEYLAQKIATNIRELEGALNRVIAHFDLMRLSPTVENAQECLRDILKSHERRVTPEEIQRKVSEHWNIRVTDMTSARRARAVARPRQVAMYLAKQLTSCSLPEIGRKFGNRDHTTVMHAVSKVTKLLEEDSSFAESVNFLRRSLES